MSEARWLTEPRHVCQHPPRTNERDGGLWRCECGLIWESMWDGWRTISERKAQRILARVKQ